MARLLDLSTEILLHIIGNIEVDEYERRKYVIPRLSLVCKRFNDVCGHLIFRSYKLVLRSSGGRCFFTGQSLDHWKDEAVRTRLRHLKSKADFVRKLRIVDYRVNHPDEGESAEALPAEFVPELLETLTALQGLVSVIFEGRDDGQPSPFPVALWDWVASVKPNELGFRLLLTFPDNLQPIHGVEELHIFNYDEQKNSIVTMLKPPILRLVYPWSGELFKFVPYEGIRYVGIEADLMYTKTGPQFFDFTQIPEARVTVRLSFNVEYKMHIPIVWKKYSRKLPSLFVEDLALWDVRRSGRCSVVLRRLPPGFGGTPAQEHVPDEEKEREEAERMDAYYARRAQKYCQQVLQNSEAPFSHFVPSMACLLNLSAEVLLMIIANLEQDRSPYQKTYASRMSLVCKQLNDVCGNLLFRSYPLVLRRYRGYCFITDKPTEHWEDDAIHARLGHLRSKAALVRKLRIVDDKAYHPRENEPTDALPADIIPDLLSTLKLLRSLVSVSFEGRSDLGPSPFPVPVWDWLASVRLNELGLKLSFTFPDSLEPIDGIQELHIKPYNEAMSQIVTKQRAPTLHLQYPWQGDLYKFEAYEGLENVHVEADILRSNPPPKLFDFTPVPQAKVVIKLSFDVEYKFHIPGAWKSNSRRLPSLFAEDLADWDVHRSDQCSITLERLEPGFKGFRRQDHVPDERKEKEEVDNMRGHYELRAWQEEQRQKLQAERLG
ncbi:hypothetical protein EVG20_g6093 [Dentipellis fragilis]|uniref:F-box domain-containing protein n=1 Tax=Dentipellis fragilis TaxID=205917 RepID=A0A4Y9YQF0_9AGAM|nr:hypothetical protein EVG20_g6093 [Dentipellis fragilis]